MMIYGGMIGASIRKGGPIFIPISASMIGIALAVVGATAITHPSYDVVETIEQGAEYTPLVPLPSIHESASGATDQEMGGEIAFIGGDIDDATPRPGSAEYTAYDRKVAEYQKAHPRNGLYGE